MGSEPSTNSDRLDFILAELSSKSNRMNQQNVIEFSDHASYGFNFFAEFDIHPNLFLVGPVSLFLHSFSHLIHRDIRITAARTGCVTLFFGVNDFGSDNWKEFRESETLYSILDRSKITLLHANREYIRRSGATGSKFATYLDAPGARAVFHY